MAELYNFEKDVFDGVESYKVGTASGVETGQMMQWDPNARIATVMTTTSGAIFLGVSQEANPLVGLGTSDRPLTGDRVRIKSQGVHDFKTTSGDTYSHLDPVYMGADAQTVTKIGSGRIVGRVHLPDGTQVTGGSGTNVTVRIFGSYTNNSVVPSSADAAK